MATINLAWCCDDNYAPHMGAALCSVLHNLSSETQACIYIVYSKLHNRNKKKIASILETYHARAHFIEIDLRRFEGLKLSHYISPAAYFRIALPDLLPKTVSKVLYLDCDLIAREDLTPLATTDIGTFYIGAVAEGDQFSWCVNALKHMMGVPHDAAYFNSGVVLINLEKWRDNDISKKLFEFIRENPHRIRWWDQDAMNIFFHAGYMHLDYRWNCTIQNLVRPEIYNTENISIIHFITGVKPWHAGCDHPFKGEYYKYLAMTPWGSLAPQKVPAGNKWLGQTARIIKTICREILSIYSLRSAIRARTILCKEEIAVLRARFALKSILINYGILKKSLYETLLTYKVHFFFYEDFLLQFDKIFVNSDYYFDAAATKPCIIDCGSNIGMAVLYFKRLYPYSHIIAFEPDTTTFKLLQENVQSNRLEDVQLHNSAVGARTGEIELPYDASLAASGQTSSYGSCLPSAVKTKSGTREVPRSNTCVTCVQLSSYIDGPVDFLKMDIGGTEHAVIEELVQSGKLRLIKKIVITYHHNMPAHEKGLSGLLEILEKHGFGSQVRADYWGFGTGTEKVQTIMIFAYNKKAG